MATWQVRAHPRGGWQVVTPGGTQACARLPDRPSAIAAACLRIGDEGGGVLVVFDAAGEVEDTRAVSDNPVPYGGQNPQDVAGSSTD